MFTPLSDKRYGDEAEGIHADKHIHYLNKGFSVPEYAA
jgi:hypothetical protein